MPMWEWFCIGLDFIWAVNIVVEMGIGRLEVLQQSVVRRAWDRDADRTDELFLVVSCYQVPHNISIKMASWISQSSGQGRQWSVGSLWSPGPCICQRQLELHHSILSKHYWITSQWLNHQSCTVSIPHPSHYNQVIKGNRSRQIGRQ